MNNKDMPAMPIPIAGCNDGGVYHTLEVTGGYFGGLTKREYFAGLAMQGLLACSEVAGYYPDIAKGAVNAADALLAELEKEPAKARGE